ncbi:MAG: flagellar hook-basal body complex protein [Lachnospiraceae bacterium]|nr:flagellar hook-basal body complex protein [Lachnospiraceae bacterium]
MMRSLFSGVSGLRTHQTRMDVIGNNIANVNTTAFKAKQMNFSDMLYQTTQAATGANSANNTGGTNPRQIGLGVKAAAINTTITQEGANQSTGNPFDLKISGEAFFVVSDGTSTYYTRDGSFDVDDAGNLCMASTGYIVQGWGVDANGDVQKGTLRPINTRAVDVFEADATTRGRISGILDSNSSEFQNENGRVVNVPVYDKAGYTYNVQFGILPATSEQTTVRSTLNTENEWTPSNTIYKVDTSKLSFKYQTADGEKTLKSSEMPPELLEKLETEVRKVVNGGTSSLAGITTTGTHTMGAAGDWATVDLGAFIGSDADLDGKVLTNSELRGMTLTVNFSGGTGFVKAQPTSFPVTDAIVIPEEAVAAFYTAGATNTDGTITYNYGVAGGTTGTITSVKQTYTDDNGDSVTKYEFKYGAAPGTIINADNGSGTQVSAGSAYGEAIMKLLSMGSKGDKTNTFMTDTPQISSQVIKGEFKISLLGITDTNKAEVNIDALRNGGTTSWTIKYNEDDGQFSYVGAEGESSFTLNLSSLDTKFENLTVDMSETSNVDNEKKNTVDGVRVDGRKVGKLLGVSVGTDGIITASYSNGMAATLGQICVAKFANAMGLENAGDNLYQTTASSGDASVVDIKAEGIGSINSGILEMSNVDLSQQFTDMITTQRGFQANSRIITTSDTLLEELVNLKR